MREGKNATWCWNEPTCLFGTLIKGAIIFYREGAVCLWWLVANMYVWTDGQIDRQKAMHMIPPCRSTGVLKNQDSIGSLMDLLCEPDTSGFLLGQLKGGGSVSRVEVKYFTVSGVDLSGIVCPHSRVSGNVRCRNNPFHGPSWWTYCVHCGPTVVLL